MIIWEDWLDAQVKAINTFYTVNDATWHSLMKYAINITLVALDIQELKKKYPD